jgi:predicted RecB family nuclease
MLKVGRAINLSASDLVGHLNCRYLTALDLAVANGTLAKPFIWDPVLEVLAERGALHEQDYVDHLKTNGLSVTTIDGVGVDSSIVTQTFEAMKAGVQIIAQGALQVAHWSGRADILRRVEKPSHFGPWSYEVIDTKLARETKGSTVLQICLYSELVAAVQKRVPEFAYVVTPGSDFQPEEFRLADYAAYYRRVKRSLERAVTSEADVESYPDPNPHCDVCRWRLHCEEKRRADDHLCLVAGISKLHIGELKRHDITTTANLASVPLGDPFVGEGGLEFLFGYAFKDKNGSQSYTADWALSRVEEKAAFERFVDFVIGRLEEFPDLHIYHYAPYEPAALKRLMGRYATREEELDRMLRAGLFVDLYAVVRHGIRASVESYSIKKLEPLYEFDRAVPLTEANKALVKIQACLELDGFEDIKEEDRTVIQGYNRDDCLSTWRLRDWLESLRSKLISAGAVIDRPLPKTGDASEDLTDQQKKIAALIHRLTDDVPVDVAERSAEQHAKWLLAYILDWHRREDKAAWWEYFRLCDLSVEDLLEERAALSGLTFVGAVGGTDKAPIHRCRFPPQDTDLRGDEDLRSVGGVRFGSVEAISLEHRTVDIKKRKDTASFHPEAVFAHLIVPSKVLADALVRIGEYVAYNGMTCDGHYQAARDLLMVAGPRVGGEALKRAQETGLAAAMRIAPHLDCGVFCSGSSWRRKDAHRRAHDLHACAIGEEDRNHGQQPQGHSQPLGRGYRSR